MMTAGGYQALVYLFLLHCFFWGNFTCLDIKLSSKDMMCVLCYDSSILDYVLIISQSILIGPLMYTIKSVIRNITYLIQYTGWVAA